MANEFVVRKGLIIASGSISGSATSTGSFGHGYFDGQVGIGTTSLGSGNSKLTIKVASNGDDFITFDNASDLEVMSIDTNSSGDALLYMYDSSGNEGIKLHSDAQSYFLGGNIGIGTNSPGAKLEVIGNISGSATSTGSFGAGYIDNKLGIGTTAPAGKLHIQEAGSNFAIYVDGGTGARNIFQNVDDSNYKLKITYDGSNYEI